MNKPSIALGTKVSHPSVGYPLEVFAYYYISSCSMMGYSNKVRCMGTDEAGVEHKHYLFPVSELTLL